MAIFAEINGTRIRTGTITVPYHGVWHADLVLDQGAVFTNPLTLVLGNLVMVGAVFRQGTFSDSTKMRVVGGNGGWQNTLQPKEYRSSFGLKFSLVAGDAAREVGEKLSVGADFAVGLFYDRQQASAARVLDTFAPLWWVRSDGVTMVGERPTPVVTSRFDVIDADLGRGKVLVATDFPGDWQPGVRFSSPIVAEQQVSGVVHRLDKDKLRTELWTL